MRALLTMISISVLAGTAFAQQPSPGELKTFTSSADVVKLIENAKRETKNKDLPNFTQSLLQSNSYKATLEYRAKAGTPSIHEAEAELIYIVDGSATFVTGGKLINEKRTNATNVGGTGIENGETRKVSKGDFIMVPQGTPHWFSGVDGGVAFMALHLPTK